MQPSRKVFFLSVFLFLLLFVVLCFILFRNGVGVENEESKSYTQGASLQFKSECKAISCCSWDCLVTVPPVLFSLETFTETSLQQSSCQTEPQRNSSVWESTKFPCGVGNFFPHWVVSPSYSQRVNMQMFMQCMYQNWRSGYKNTINKL